MKGRAGTAPAWRAKASTHSRSTGSESGQVSWPFCSSRSLFPSPRLTLHRRRVWRQGWRGGSRRQSTPQVWARLPPHPSGPPLGSRTRPFQARPLDRVTQEVTLHPCRKGRRLAAAPRANTLTLPVQNREDPSQTTGWDRRPGYKGLVRTLI